MKDQQNNKTKWLHLRLSEDEYGKVYKQFKKTTCRKLSEYARNKLLDRHLTTYYRNQSLDDFMAEAMKLRESLNMAGNNFNQAVRKLNSMQQNENVERWLITWELDKRNLLKQVEEIKNQIKIFAEQWLRNSTQTHP